MATLTIKNIPDDLHNALKRMAQEHHRSLNGEVIHCLIKGLSREETLSANDILSDLRLLRKGVKGYLVQEKLAEYKSQGRK